MKGPHYTGDDDDPGECEGCGSDKYDYRASMGYYLCEDCHEKGVRAYAKAAGVSGTVRESDDSSRTEGKAEHD